jgi:hypothetical protein
MALQSCNDLLLGIDVGLKFWGFYFQHCFGEAFNKSKILVKVQIYVSLDGLFPTMELMLQ